MRYPIASHLSQSFVAIVFLLALASCSQSPISSQATIPPASDQPGSTEVDETSEKGQIDHNGDLSFAVLGWEISKGNKDNTPEQGEQFILVDVLIVNQGNRPLDILLFRFKLQDAQLVEYGPDFSYQPTEPFGLTDYFSLPPNEQVRGQVVFQVPETSSGFIFDVFDAMDSENKVSIALGSTPVVYVPAPQLIPNPNAHKVGETVRQGDITLEIMGWDQGGQGVQPEQGYRFLVVDLMLENKGEPVGGFSSTPLMLLRDNNGYVYDIDHDIYVEGAYFSLIEFIDELNTHKPVRAKLVFKVLDSSSAYVCIFFPNVLFGEEAGDPIIVDLGSQPTSNTPPP